MQDNNDITVTRAYLAEQIHKKLGYSRAESSEFIDLIIDEIIETIVKEGELKISAFGTLAAKEKKPRIGRNPKTKKEAIISARKVVSFYASTILKDKINRNLIGEEYIKEMEEKVNKLKEEEFA